MREVSVVLRLLLLVSLLPLFSGAMAQQPLRPPQIAPFGDSEWWILPEALPTRIGRSNEVITVPSGFVTDLTSVPRFFWSALPKTGQYMSAAILHDYLYWDQRCTRAQADHIFDIEMLSYGVNETARKLLFAAVSEFGAKAWATNAEAKASGEPRFLTSARLAQFLSQPFDATRTWAAVREELMRDPPAERGTADPNTALAEVCSRAIAANGQR